MVPIVASRCDSVSCSRRAESCFCIESSWLWRVSSEIAMGDSNSLTVRRISAVTRGRLDAGAHRRLLDAPQRRSLHLADVPPSRQFPFFGTGGPRGPPVFFFLRHGRAARAAVPQDYRQTSAQPSTITR